MLELFYSILGNIVAIPYEQFIPFRKVVQITLAIAGQNSFVQSGKEFKNISSHIHWKYKIFLGKKDVIKLDILYPYL